MSASRESHVDARLQAYLDGETTRDESAAIEAHVVACAPCRRALDELREVQAMLRGDEAPALARSIWPQLSQHLAPAQPWWSPALGFATAGAAVAGIVIGLMVGAGTTSRVATNDQDLWSAVGASFAVDHGVTVADFPTTDNGEGS